MKTIYKSLFTLGLGSLALLNTSCIDEVEPMGGSATQKQIESSSKATEAVLWGMPAYFNVEDADNAHYRFGYGSMMEIRESMTEDFVPLTTSYEWFSAWLQNRALGRDYAYGQYIWNYYYHLILTTNNMVGAVPNPDAATDEQKGYLGAGHAFRAMCYLDIARMYEFLPNDKTSSVNADGNNVENLTVPIITDQTSEEAARSNPRVYRDAASRDAHRPDTVSAERWVELNPTTMEEFILSDLQNAEKYIPYLTLSTKTLPHLDVVYGLYARYYMWLENYAKAEEYARKAIDAYAGSPMTKEEALDVTTGFNDISKWMWGSQQVAEDGTVETAIVNWTSWMSNEAQFGYVAAGPMRMINRATYDQIRDTDWRKLEWKAPEGSALDGKNSYVDEAFAQENLPDYASLKFRPNNGETEDYKVGAASAYPLMRVEEMYFIEAEAAAQQNAARGRQLLTDFMTEYRDSKYVCPASDQQGVIDEIFFQKRIELWGEGLNYFDYKRLNKPVTRGYAGTNWTGVTNAILNTTTRPAWMNFVIVITEENNNDRVRGFNNPDPSGLYTPWTGN